jgi:predicted N-acetyltransferase YhbS
LAGALAIHDLRERPQHAEAVAQRIWNAFWRRHGAPFAQVRDGLAEILKNQGGVPFALVTEDDGEVCGNILVIDNDEPARPALGPWIAAVWVDQAQRKRGIAQAMIDEAVRRTAALGITRIYLVSRPALRPFYARLGWQEIEDEVGEHRLVVWMRDLSGPRASRLAS